MKMGVYLMVFALVGLASAARAEDRDFTTAIFVTSVHDAQIVHADDGMDRVEYELLVVNAFARPPLTGKGWRAACAGNNALGARPPRGPLPGSEPGFRDTNSIIGLIADNPGRIGHASWLMDAAKASRRPRLLFIGRY